MYCHVMTLIGTVVALGAITAAIEPDQIRMVDRSDPHAQDCPVCGPVVERVESVRGLVDPPVVTRPSNGIIVVEGAQYAGTRPYSPPIQGADVLLAEMSVSWDLVEPIIFSVDPTREYEVWAAVEGPDQLAVPFDFVVGVDRIDQVQHFLTLAQEARSLKASLEPISFMEYVQAIQRMNLQGAFDNERRDQIQGDHRDDREQPETRESDVRDPEAEPAGP